MVNNEIFILFNGSMTRKKPWNRIDLPVYSISSSGSDNKPNMHIITYVTAVSMQPKRFICGIYHGTRTLDNIRANPHFVLQLLSARQYRLVDLLGKKSGSEIDKIARLKKRNELLVWHGFSVLKNCLAVMELKIIDWIEGGDHSCCLCDLIGYKNLQEGNPLTLDILRQHKLVRM